jgi:hypothetical protein
MAIRFPEPCGSIIKSLIQIQPVFTAGVSFRAVMAPTIFFVAITGNRPQVKTRMTVEKDVLG